MNFLLSLRKRISLITGRYVVNVYFFFYFDVNEVHEWCLLPVKAIWIRGALGIFFNMGGKPVKITDLSFGIYCIRVSLYPEQKDAKKSIIGKRTGGTVQYIHPTIYTLTHIFTRLETVSYGNSCLKTAFRIPDAFFFYSGNELALTDTGWLPGLFFLHLSSTTLGKH